MKTNIFILTIVLVLSICNFSIAQFQSFDLSKYKNSDYRYQGLDFTFNFGNNYQFNDYDEKNFNSSDYKNNHFQLQGSSGVNYWNVINSRKYQGEQSANFVFSGLYASDRHKDYVSTTTGKNFAVVSDIWLSSINRFYFNPQKQLFYEINPLISQNIEIENSDDHSANPVETNETKSNLFTSIPISIGIGRIEEIQDARLAVYILEDLQKNGQLKRIPSETEIIEFAETITKIKNQRHLDSRIRKIKEITALDEFIHSKDLANGNNAAYFTSLNDNWDFGSGPYRSSGYRVSFGIIPNIRFEKTRNEVDPSNSSDSIYSSLLTSRSIIGSIRFDHEKPLNLYWQRSIFGQLSHEYYYSDLTRSHIDTLHSHYAYSTLSAGYEQGFYPNTRTSITGSAYCNLYYMDIKYLVSSDIHKNLYIQPALRVDATYYFSEHLLFNSTLQINYSRINSQVKTQPQSLENTHSTFNYSLEARLVYSLF